MGIYPTDSRYAVASFLERVLADGSDQKTIGVTAKIAGDQYTGEKCTDLDEAIAKLSMLTDPKLSMTTTTIGDLIDQIRGGSKEPITSCRVCGHQSEGYFPWGEDGLTPSFDICECCNVEFGYEDFTPESTSRYREKWIANGANWSDRHTRPEDWDYREQLKNVPEVFR